MPTLYLAARVFDGLGAVLDDHGVMVDGDTIVDVSPRTAFGGFDGKTVTLAEGTLLPGLIDCHVHILYGAEGNPTGFLTGLSDAQAAVRGLEHARLTVEAGVTSVRDVGGRNFAEFAVRDACNAGRFPGPTMRAAGRVICMTGGHGNRFGRIADGVEDITRAVREHVHAGSDLIKMMATGGVMTPGVDPRDAHYTEDELRAGVTEAKRFRRTTASHAQGTGGVPNATRAGVDSIEHGIWLDETCIAEMLARGTYLVPTLAAVANIVANADRGIPAYAVEKASVAASAHRESVKAFHRAGGKIAMGTDAGTPFNRHGENPQELRLMAEIGIPPIDILVSSTSHGADLMQMADRGRIAAGAKADLLLVDGDPTADIEAAADPARHHLVVKDGRPVAASRAA